MINNKERYRQLCETEGGNIPLFQQYWWMETVCEGKKWDVIVTENEGHIDGAMPFLYGRKMGLKYILQPQLTPWSGPWLRPELDDAGRQAALDALAAGLRGQKAVLCMQRFSPMMTDWLPFRRHGFRQTTRYTYRFDPLPEPSMLRMLADRGRRRGVDEVEEAYIIDRSVGVDEFVAFHKEYWERRNGRDLLSPEFMQRVCTAAIGRGQGMIYGLRDSKGTLMAARFVAYDSNCAYALLSALRADALRNCMTVIVWTMLTDLYGRTKAFDFEGGMDPGVGHFYSSFGTVKTPYHCIYRSCLPFAKILLHL